MPPGKVRHRDLPGEKFPRGERDLHLTDPRATLWSFPLPERRIPPGMSDGFGKVFWQYRHFTQETSEKR